MAISIIMRAEARAQGFKRYFTGKPCKRGHICERQVASLTCMECDREKHAASWKTCDRQKERQRRQSWRAANREKDNEAKRERGRTPEGKAYKAAWFQANKARLRDKRRARYATDPAKRLAGNRAWIEANPERFAEHMRTHARKRRAQKKGSAESHTIADLAEIFSAQNGRCAYCLVSLKKTKRHVDHIIPLARGGSNGRSNLQYLCQPCNQSKSARDPATFARSIGLLL